MPVAVKLSERFYQRLGDDVTNELVGVLNAVDVSYRQEFQDLFQANFGRVESRMEALEARVEARMREITARMEALEARVEARMREIAARMEALEARLDTRMEAMEARMDAKLAELKSELLRWMFLFWVGTMGTVLAILKL